MAMTREEALARRRAKYAANPEKDRARSLANRAKNLEARRASSLAYYHANKETMQAANRKYHKRYRVEKATELSQQQKQWREDNKEHHAAKKREHTIKYRGRKLEIHNLRYKNDPQYKTACLLRGRMKMALKTKAKTGSAVRDLGCSIETFIVYIAEKFTPGMSWDNHGEWHLDHIKPLSLFDLTDRDQFLKAAHYTNYQPLWAVDNLIKSNKYGE